jgi:hypothetical protein
MLKTKHHDNQSITPEWGDKKIENEVMEEREEQTEKSVRSSTQRS